MGNSRTIGITVTTGTKLWLTALIAAIAVGAVPSFAAPPPDDVIIANGGSAKTAAWKIHLYADGTGVAFPNLPRVVPETNGAAYLVPVGSNPGHDFTISNQLASHFFSDLHNARVKNSMGLTCAKNSTYGSTTFVQWHNWTSADLECPQSDPQFTILAQDVHTLERASGITSGP